MNTYSEKLKNPKWQKKRLEIFERDQWLCRHCLAADKTLAVHHIIYKGKYPWDTPDKFLITLCEECHTKEEFMKANGLDLNEIIQSGLTYGQIFSILTEIKRYYEVIDNPDLGSFINVWGFIHEKYIEGCEFKKLHNGEKIH